MLEVAISNPRKMEFDRFSVSLSFDPQTLELLDVDDAPLSGMLNPAIPPVIELGKAGQLSFAAQLTEPVNWARRELLTVHFRALSSTPRTIVEFVTSAGETMLLNGENIILGDSGGGFDRGTLGATVIVRPEGGMGGDANWTFDREVRSMIQPETSSRSFVTIALSTQNQSVAVGEVFDVQLLLDNPDALPLELLSVVLRFDPELLQVVDADEGNAIHQGVNINDGPYREAFPFTSHLQNTVDNGRGRIAYAVATGQPNLLATRGRMATIRFQALAAADFAPVWFDQDARGAVSSEALARGANVLVRPEDARPAVRGLILRVQSPIGVKPPAPARQASKLEE
jgi:hypothetical protein